MTKILDNVAAAGSSGIELTFPFNWQHALKTAGSVGGSSKAMDERGLTLASGFFADLEHGSDIADPTVRIRVFDLAKRYAEAIKACGGDAMVVGLPMRRTRDSDNPLFVDMVYAQRLCEVLNELGAMTLRQGVRLALHTEAHSVLCTGAMSIPSCSRPTHSMSASAPMLRIFSVRAPIRSL
ncbi:MAG: sugar phosphate isomerase/epimerase [Candidatus Devosia euplotis]|nr:sugar phosphate isomerase/epimerase [Candidatus Devosia euplotis]